MKRKYVVVPTDARGNKLPLDRLTPKENLVANVILFGSIAVLVSSGFKMNTLVI